MKPTARLVLCLALLADAGSFASAAEPAVPPAAPPAAGPQAPRAADPAESDRVERLRKADATTHAGDPKGAIALIDEVIAEYERQYPEGKTRWYIARTLPETLAYTTGATFAPDDRHRDTAVLDVAWAEAYFLKAYALVEASVGSGAYKTNKGGNPESDPEYLARARAVLERGLQLEPYHARMLAELGNLLQLQQDWNGMLRVFTDAETAAAYQPEGEQGPAFGRAKRGIGYALIELGRLDEAEAKFRECLRIDPDDAGAKNELEYIRQLREKH